MTKRKARATGAATGAPTAPATGPKEQVTRASSSLVSFIITIATCILDSLQDFVTDYVPAAREWIITAREKAPQLFGEVVCWLLRPIEWTFNSIIYPCYAFFNRCLAAAFRLMDFFVAFALSPVQTLKRFYAQGRRMMTEKVEKMQQYVQSVRDSYGIESCNDVKEICIDKWVALLDNIDSRITAYMKNTDNFITRIVEKLHVRSWIQWAKPASA